MKLALIVILAFCIAACGNDRAEEPASTPEPVETIEWLAGVKSLEQYRSENPNRRIFAFFTMKGYDIVGLSLEHQLNQNRRDLFGSDDVLFLRFDCTDQESLGLRELEKLKLNYIPVFVTTKAEGWKFTSNPNEYEDLLTGFVGEVAALMR